MDLVPLKKHSLRRAQFEKLADVPPEEEWLANITNLKTRRAYKEDVREFISFTALQDYMGLRSVGRSHIILAQGHGKTRPGAGQTFGASSRRFLALRLPLRTQRCYRQSGGRSETASGLRN